MTTNMCGYYSMAKLIAIIWILFNGVFHLIQCSSADIYDYRQTVSEHQALLAEYLFTAQKYNKLIRPVTNQSAYVNIKFGLAMTQLIHVDERNQIMKSNVWLRFEWEDFQLKWDPEEYGGVTSFRVPYDYVWKPDIVLFNNADGKFEVSFKSKVVLHNSGTALWVPPAIFKSSCTIDVEFFPFDQQKCFLKFGSWTYNARQILLDWYAPGPYVDLTDYVNSGAWDIIGCPGKITFEEDTDKKNQTYAIFEIKIRRKTLFFTVNLIIPCVFISLLSVCVFYLPADAGEKTTMCVSILLALVVFLLLVSKILPPSSITIPLIAKYLLFTFIMNIFSIVFTVVILNWNFRTPRTHRMSKWVRLIFLKFLPKVLFMSRPSQNDSKNKETHTQFPINASHSSNQIKQYANVNAHNASGIEQMPLYGMNQHNRNSSGAHEHHPDCAFANRANNHNPRSNSHRNEQSVQIPSSTHKALEAVRFIAAHLKNEDDYAEIVDDWKYIGTVIDRFLLYVFLAVTIGGTVSILLNAPHIFEYSNQCQALQNQTK